MYTDQKIYMLFKDYYYDIYYLCLCSIFPEFAILYRHRMCIKIHTDTEKSGKK